MAAFEIVVVDLRQTPAAPACDWEESQQFLADNDCNDGGSGEYGLRLCSGDGRGTQASLALDSDAAMGQLQSLHRHIECLGGGSPGLVHRVSGGGL